MRVIKVADICGKEVLSRSNAKRLASQLPDDCVVLDLSEVTFITRSVADELLGLVDHSLRVVDIVGQHGAVATMLDIVSSARKSQRAPIKHQTEVISCDTMEEFSKILLKE